MKKYIVLTLIALSVCSCNKKSDDGGTTSATGADFLPSIVTLVDKSSPSTFKTAQFQTENDTIHSSATAANAAEALKDFFTDNVMSISGKTKAGFIRSYLNDLDTRISEIETANTTEPTCFSATPVSFTFDAGVTNQSMTVKLSCARSFSGSGDQSGAGSGLAFGQDDTYKYMYLLLVQSNGTDKFGYVAKVNKSTEQVDLLFLEYSPSNSRTKFFRLRTTPSTSQYELVYAGTSDGPGPTQSQTAHGFGPGVRLIANSTSIRVDGSVATQTNSSGSATTFAFDSTECFSTSSLSTAASTCSGSAPSFATDMTLIAASSLVAAATTVNTSLKTMTTLISSGVTSN